MENNVNEKAETKETMNQEQAADQVKDAPKKPGFVQRAKTFGKEKVLPAAKFVGKGLVKGAAVAGGALGTAFLIGMAAGGYSAIKGNAEEESSDNGTTTTDQPVDQSDVQISLNENNVNVDSNIE